MLAFRHMQIAALIANTAFFVHLILRSNGWKVWSLRLYGLRGVKAHLLHPDSSKPILNWHRWMLFAQSFTLSTKALYSLLELLLVQGIYSEHKALQLEKHFLLLLEIISAKLAHSERPIGIGPIECQH